MHGVIKKWGNSAAVRLPATLMNAAELKPDQTVNVREEAGRIIIEPIAHQEYILAELLAEITPENVHSDVDFGLPVGKELL